MDINADICSFLIISRNVKINVTKKVKTVDLWCVCGVPEFFDNMVGCENRNVENGFIGNASGYKVAAM